MQLGPYGKGNHAVDPLGQGNCAYALWDKGIVQLAPYDKGNRAVGPLGQRESCSLPSRTKGIMQLAP